MDEPTLFVRDGAFCQQIPLTALLVMIDAARDIAEGAITDRNQDAARTAEAVMRQQNRGQAAVSAYLLQHYMGRAQERVQAKTIVSPPQQSVAGEASPAAGTAAAANPGAAATGPCNHPPDIACPNCAASHQEARNAKKRAAARA